MDALRIGRVVLRDIGPFVEVDVGFSEGPGLNLICGDNGIGKTTLLEGIASAFTHGNTQRLKRRQAGTAGSVTVSYSVNGEPDDTIINVSAFEPDKSEFIKGAGRDRARSVINIRAARDFSYIRQEGISRDPAADDMANRLMGGLNTTEIKTWFTNRYLLQHHAGWSPEMLDNLASAISFFSLLDPTVSLDRVDIRTFDVLVSTPSGVIPYEYLSSGFRSAYILFLGILKEIEFRNLNVAAKDFSGLILIDEIDLHLHPVWQREIGSALKNAFPNAQIIASTHSPHVIQVAQATEVIALHRETDGVVKARSVPSAQYGYAGWALEEVLQDIMGVADTKTKIFRDAMQNFDEAIDRDDATDVLGAAAILREMLHPNNALRKLIEIQIAPYIGATPLNEDSQ